MNLDYNLTFFCLSTVLIALFSLLFDLTISDPESKIHPVNLMGKLLTWLKKKIRTDIKIIDKIFGMLMLMFVITFFFIPIYFIQSVLYLISVFFNLFINWNFNFIFILIFSILMGFVMKWTFSIHYLGKVTKEIQKELTEGNIERSRILLSYIVRRDTKSISEQHLISASVEVIAESSTDSVISAFWFYFVGNLLGLILYLYAFNHIGLLFLGVPFAYMFRVINTGDSIVGYKDPENINIGWFSAKMDDISNYIPTRITVLFMLIAGKIFSQQVKKGWKVMKKDKNNTESLNAGWLMSLTAGLLGVQLEKIGSYKLGDPTRLLDPKDIELAYNIVVFTTLSFIFIVGFIFVIIELLFILVV